jgi:hypothetical protein
LIVIGVLVAHGRDSVPFDPRLASPADRIAMTSGPAIGPLAILVGIVFLITGA